jgi:putative acetyltransferase
VSATASNPAPADVRIRRFEPKDAAALGRLYYRSVHEAGRNFYSPEQVAVWAPEVQPPEFHLARAADGRTVLVAVTPDDAPVAYGDFEPDGHVDHLYCDPAFIGRGIASRLYDALEALARARHIPRFHVEASEAARPLFAHKGFTLIERRDFLRHGVSIHNYAMAKDLTAG